MILSKKVRLYPTKEQEKKFREFSGTSRYVYNYCLSKKEEYYKKGVNLSSKDLRHFIVCQRDKNTWLKEVPEAVTKKAIEDLDIAYKNFFKGKSEKPKKHKKKYNRLSFYQRTDTIRVINNKRIKLTGIKDLVKCNYVELPTKVYNPRITYDGKYWYINFGYDISTYNESLTDEVLGIDLGIKNTAILSNGNIYPNINKTERVQRIEKHIKKLKRKISHKYESNKVGKKYIKTNNIKKLERKEALLERQLTNIRNTYNHYITSEIVKTKPSKIVIEDLDIQGLMRDKSMSKAIQEQKWYDIRTKLEYKSQLHGIELVIANRYYASSKRCSCCGKKKKFLSLSERTYYCDKCGLILDRDYNASLNLRQYGIA